MTKPRVGMSEKQRYSVKNATGRVNIFEGSIRAGKTFSWLLIMLNKIRLAGPEGAIIIVGKNRDAIYRNVFEPLESIPALQVFENEIHYRQGAATAKIFGRTVHCIGANDAKSENKIRGMSVQLAFVDEVTVVDQSFFKQLLGRMSIAGAQLFGTTNPGSPSHWLKVDYLDRMGTVDADGVRQLPDWRRFHFTIDDNPSLTDDYKRAIKGEYTGLWFRRFILGHWVSADGAVYDMWDPDEHIVKWDDLPQMQEYFGVGVDYGTTNATAALLLGIGSDGILYLVDEWRHQSSSAEARWTDMQLSQGLRTWMTKKHHPTQDLAVGPLIVDPAAASFRVQLKADGQHSYPASNDVLYGIRLVASLLAAGKLRVSSRCKGLLTEVVGYSWDAKATENGKDSPIKVNDHSADGARYVIATTEKRWRRYIELATPAKNAA